jgi:hypothetical protein
MSKNAPKANVLEDQIANAAFLYDGQARAIDAIVAEVESATGKITAAERAEVDHRLQDARRRAEERRERRR